MFDHDLDDGLFDHGEKDVHAEAAAKPDRTKCLVDRSEHIPVGCTMRKYQPQDPKKPAYWKGQLRRGCLDADGYKSRSRTWANKANTIETDVIEDIDNWLWEYCGDAYA